MRILVFIHFSYQVNDLHFKEFKKQLKQHPLPKHLSDLFISWVKQGYFKQLHLYLREGGNRKA